MSFLVLWSICWSSSLVHFLNGPEFLTKGSPRCLSLWWGFYYIALFWAFFFSVSLIYFLNVFFHLYLLLSYSLGVFTLPWAGELSLESERQQVSLSLQESSQYSGRSQQCCSLDGLDFSTNFHFLCPFQTFGDCSKCINYNWYNSPRHVPLIFFFSGKVQIFVYLCCSGRPQISNKKFPFLVCRNGKID